MLKNLRWSSLFGGNNKKDTSEIKPSIQCFQKEFIDAWCQQHDAMSLEFLAENPDKKVEYRNFENSIRLVVFMDSCARRELLFDSRTVVKLPGGSPPQKTEKERERNLQGKGLSRSATIPAQLHGQTAAGCRWKLDHLMRGQEHLKPYAPKFSQSKQANDLGMLRELIFGNMELNYKGNCVKVHTNRSPLKIFTTKVFQRESASHNSSLSDSGTMNKSISLSHIIDLSTAIPHCELGIAGCRRPSRDSSRVQFIAGSVTSCSSTSIQEENLTDSDDASSSPKTASPIQSPRSFNSTGVSLRAAKAFITSISSQQVFLEESKTIPASTRRRVDRYGVCLCYQPFHDDTDEQDKFYDFFFTHNSLFEALLHEISSEILHTFSLDPQVTRLDPLECILKCLTDLRKKVRRLYFTSLLSCPVWLTLSSQPSLTSLFVSKCLSPALLHLNHSHQSQFLSCLVSAVLTHHIAWVETASAALLEQLDTGLPSSGSSSVVTPEQARACCPQWMQLCQLYGILGFPRCLARTIVVGSNDSLVLFIVYLISYFIRCSDVFLKAETLPELKTKFEVNELTHKTSASSSASSSSDYSSDNGAHSPMLEECETTLERATSSPSSDYHSDVDQNHQSSESLKRIPKRDPLISVPLSMVTGQSTTFNKRHHGSLGRHLLRGLSDKLIPLAAVQGTTDRTILESPSLIKQELGFSLEHDMCGEPISTSVLVIVDTDNFQVSVKSLSANSTRVHDSGPIKPALSIHRLLMSLHYLIQLGMPAQSCLSYLEVGLQKLERSGRALGALLRHRGEDPGLTALQLAAAVRADVSDLPLLFSVASTQYKYLEPT